MFVGFFYLLRQRGFSVSLNEWMTLMEGLSLGLHRSTLTGFYDLCRAVLVKSEANYDKFDAAFLEYFKDVPFPEELLPDELMDWLNHPKNALEEFRAFLREQGYAEKSIDEILKMFEERLREQTEEHARSLALKHRDADHHDRHCELMRAERLGQKSRRILDNGAENQQHCENHAADYKSFLFGCETHRQVPFDKFVTL